VGVERLDVVLDTKAHRVPSLERRMWPGDRLLRPDLESTTTGGPEAARLDPSLGGAM
jgi:hypothetical protein